MPRYRKVRLALVLTLAIVAAFFAWRTSQQQTAHKQPCTPGRQEQKDSSGKVVQITHTTCLE